jgi:hypothetical protein
VNFTGLRFITFSGVEVLNSDTSQSRPNNKHKITHIEARRFEVNVVDA